MRNARPNHTPLHPGWALGLVVSILVVSAPAQAEDTARGRGVLDRPRPEYDARGIRLGSFVAYPAVDLGVGYDDNVLAEDSGRRDDAVFDLGPSLLVESDWSRHSLSLATNMRSALYPSQTDEQHTDWGVEGTGRLDLSESSDITASASFRNLTEDREDIDAIRVVLEPTEYDRLDAGAVWNHRINRVSTALGFSFTRLDFDDGPRVGGGNVDQDFRDRDVFEGEAQIAYSFLPGYSAFLRGTLNDRNYRRSSPLDRDSSGYEVVAGLASEITNLVSGEFFVGYLDQRYESGAFRDVNGFSAGLGLEWYATELTTVSLSASRRVVDSTSPGAGGILTSRAGFGVDHELLRNVLLSGEFSYENGDFEGTRREDHWLRAAVGARYLVSRRVHLRLDYVFTDRISNASNLGYLRNRILLGVRIQL